MKWIKAIPKDFDGGLSHKFFRDTKTKENLSAGAAFSFFKRNCIDLVEILDESAPVPDKVETGEWQLCPKCNGQGQVSKPPHIAGDVHEWTSSSVIFNCDVCNGAKIIAKPNWQSTQSDAVEVMADETFAASEAILFADWLLKKKAAPNGFGGWGTDNSNSWGTSSVQMYKVFKQSK